MFTIKLADLYIRIYNKYDFVFEQCTDYIVNENRCDFSVSCTEEEIIEEKNNNREFDFPDGYLESICIYRNIGINLPKYDAFIFHAAIIDYKGSAYAFTAKSGTGKSTHISLWKQYFGDSVTYINGDKPILRFENGILYAFGTPWCGKENWQTNRKSILKSVCFLERSKENSIKKINPFEASCLIINQIFLSDIEDCASKTLELIDRMLYCTDLWQLFCNVSFGAVETSSKAIVEGIYEN